MCQWLEMFCKANAEDQNKLLAKPYEYAKARCEATGVKATGVKCNEKALLGLLVLKKKHAKSSSKQSEMAKALELAQAGFDGAEKEVRFLASNVGKLQLGVHMMDTLNAKMEQQRKEANAAALAKVAAVKLDAAAKIGSARQQGKDEAAAEHTAERERLQGVSDDLEAQRIAMQTAANLIEQRQRVAEAALRDVVEAREAFATACIVPPRVPLATVAANTPA